MVSARKGFTQIILVAIILLVFVISVFIIRNMFGIRILPVNMPVISESSKPAPSTDIVVDDETVYPDPIGANWKTYRNTKYGYSIKYPQNFIVEEHEGIEYASTKFISNDIIYPQGEYQQIIKGGVITVTVSQTGDSLSYLVEQYRNNEHFSQFQPVSLGGLEAWKFVFEMLPGYEFEPKIITVKSGKQYWVTAGFAKEDNEKIIKIFDQILSTFKFTN